MSGRNTVQRTCMWLGLYSEALGHILMTRETMEALRTKEKCGLTCMLKGGVGSCVLSYRLLLASGSANGAQ